jgi:CheY-like chemotaxis protein
VAEERFKAGQYDLILMDMRMPTVDGAAATRPMACSSPECCAMRRQTSRLTSVQRQHCTIAALLIVRPSDDSPPKSRGDGS